MDFLSVIVGALIGASGTIAAALIARHQKKEEKRFPEEVMRIAENLPSLQRERLMSLRRYSKGKRVDSSSDDKAQILLATYRTMAVDKIVNVIETDDEGAVVTLTDLGWNVATALDSLK